jgi:two-component system sensor histidine kinase HydH
MLSKRVAIGFGVGFGVGISDVLLFRLLNVQMLWDGDDVTFWIVVFFSITFGIFGAAAGRIADQRELIREQLEALRVARRHAAQQEKLAAVGRLASGVAHEVRNPLGVIRSSASLLGEDFDKNSENSRAANFIVEEVDRLDDFVRQLLDFTRPLSAELTNVSLEDVVTAAARTASCTVETDISSSSVHADEKLLVQAIRNLINNACAFAQRVEVRATSTSGAFVVAVHDDGPGVADAQRDDLFEPFFTTRPDGTGLGLALVAKIAEVHGGSARYIHGRGLGPDGGGATFELRLPLDPEQTRTDR